MTRYFAFGLAPLGALLLSGSAVASSEPKGLTSELAARVQAAGDPAARIEKLLRQLAEGGSSDWLAKGPRTKEEIEKFLNDLPPKYRQMVVEYFEKLEQLQKDGGRP